MLPSSRTKDYAAIQSLLADIMPTLNACNLTPHLSLRLRPLSLILCALMTAPAQANETGETLSDADWAMNEPLPEVLTATRLRQPKARTPATVTLIQGDMIRDLGILNLWEVFRLVPGMTVGYVESNVPVVSYHGTVANDQRRLQVLVDGRAHYNPNLADVDWHNMPVPLELIERIEVTRGPNAAAYGANSFLAIINIITKAPEDTQGGQVRLVGGSRGYANYYGAYSDRAGPYDWRLSYLKRESDGFDVRYPNTAGGVTPVGDLKPFDDSYAIDTINYASVLHLDGDDSLAFNAGYNHSFEQVDKEQFGEEFGVQTPPDINGQDYYTQLKWNLVFNANHFMHAQVYYQERDREQEWRSCIPLALVGGPAGRTLCADANHNMRETRVDYELQDTLILSDDLRLVSGASYREDRFQSETYFDGSGTNYLFRLFTNIEYSPIDWLTTNSGAMWEKDANNGDFLSPRFALNVHLTENQTLRAVFSRAVRTPDAFEQSARWVYIGRNMEPAIGGETTARLLSFNAPGGLDEEKIISRELGYYGHFRLPSGVWTAEIKYFHDTLWDIISGRISIDRWDLENNVKLDQSGIELEGSWERLNDLFRLSYAYMDQDGRYSGTRVDPTASPAAAESAFRFVQLESRMTAQHSGSFAWIHRFPKQISASTAYYIADRLNFWDYQRLDVRLAKQFVTPKLTAEVAGVFQHYLNGDPILHRDNIIRDRNHFFAEASVQF